METWKALKHFHYMQGSGWYELSLGVSLASILWQHYLKKQGKVETANLVRGITLVGLGAICMEAFFRAIRYMSEVLL